MQLQRSNTTREKTAKRKQKQKAAKSAAEIRAWLAKLFGISTVNSDKTSAAAADAASTVDMTVNDTTTTAIAASVPSPPRQLLPCHCWWMFLFHLTVPIMRSNCLQLPFRLSQQPTTQRYATISQTILILSSCCRLESIKQVARERQSNMHHDECACVHIYAPAAQRCAEVICIMMSVCAYLCIGCSEMRRHDARYRRCVWTSRLSDCLSEVGITMYNIWWVIATRSIMMTLWIPMLPWWQLSMIWHICQLGTPLALNDGSSIENYCQCSPNDADFISRVILIITRRHGSSTTSASMKRNIKVKR